MQVIVAEHCGFCRGVKNAVDTALSVSAENTYVLGELIHNQDVVKLISARGIRTAERVEEVPDGATLLIRSHGVGKDVYELCEKRHLRVIDCTCGFVKNIQQIVERKSAEGKTIVIAGQTEHPEVRGLVGWCDSESYVFSSEEEDFGFLKEKEVALVSQTTFSAERFSKIAENLKKVCRKTVEIFRTICYTTIGRQRDAAQLARICDAVLVIGGLNSSNTNKLYEIAAANCPRVYRLKNADDFEYEKILIFKRVGVIAGASTPDWQTQEVLFKMAVNDAEVQATTMKDVVEEMGKEERYKKGQIISAKIVSATEEGIYVSASGKLEIMVSKDEVDCEEYSKDAYLAKVGCSFA